MGVFMMIGTCVQQKQKTLTLLIVPSLALMGCDDDIDRKKTATPTPTYIQKADGMYKICPNGAEVPQHYVCTKSTTSASYASGGGSASASQHQDDDKKVKRGGFGAKSGGKSGG